MKRLNITKEQFNKSKYFKNKYGKLEYVSESGNLFNDTTVYSLDSGYVKETGWRARIYKDNGMYEYTIEQWDDRRKEWMKTSFGTPSRSIEQMLEDLATETDGTDIPICCELPLARKVASAMKNSQLNESRKLFKTSKGKVLKFNEAIMGGGGYEPSYDDDEEPLAEWKVGEIVDIDAWQVMWEYGDEEPLPEKRWKIVNVERDENYDDCDGYCYTIVNVSNPKLKVEVSASALVERKPVKKSGRNLKKSTKKFGRKFVKESSVRNCTNELIDYAEAYPNFWETIARACLSYMSEDEVEDMARMNDLLPDDDEYTDY